MLNNIPMAMEECADRYPRLMRAMQWSACLSYYEAAATLRTIRQVRMGTLSTDMLRYGGGEAVNHFGGPQKVVQAAFRCRRITRVTRQLKSMAEQCARTWEPGATARHEIHVYDAEGVQLGTVPDPQHIAWGHALRDASREQSAYSYPSIKEGITRLFA